MDALMSVAVAAVLIFFAFLCVLLVATAALLTWVVFAQPDETWENGLVLTRDTPRAPGVDKDRPGT